MNQKQNNFKEKNLSENNKKEVKMALTYWQRILLGFAGGVLVMGGVWWFSVAITQNSKLLSLIPIILGILAVFYGRNG